MRFSTPTTRSTGRVGSAKVSDTYKPGDGYGLEHLLRAYGGMGSFNDLVIDPANSHPIDVDDTHVVYQHLRTLGAAIHLRASALQRELGSSSA